jgi:hypothetical protein
VCSGCGFLLKTPLLKAYGPRKTALVWSSLRSYRIRFRKSSATVPEEYRSLETPYHPTPMSRTLMEAHGGVGGGGFLEGEEPRRR